MGCTRTFWLQVYKPKNVHNPTMTHHCCELAKTSDWLAYLPAKLPTVPKPSSIGLPMLRTADTHIVGHHNSLLCCLITSSRNSRSSYKRLYQLSNTLKSFRPNTTLPIQAGSNMKLAFLPTVRTIQ